MTDPLIKASIKEKICTEMEAGTPWSMACDIAGVRRDTAWRWRTDDREFRRRIAEYQSKDLRHAERTITEALTTGPIESRARVAMWLKERRDPLNYALTTAIEQAVAEVLGKDADYNGLIAELDSSPEPIETEERV